MKKSPLKQTKDKEFNDNFWKDFKTYLSPAHKKIFKKFNKIGWSTLVTKARELKEKNILLTKSNKRRKKIQTEERKKEYGYAIIDNIIEQLSNFTVEPVGLFLGRGEHPKRGKIKKEVNPEDVIINIGEGEIIPEPPKGHHWKKIVHDKKSVWLAKWTDSITNRPKYVMFSRTGRFTGQSDLEKYEKARKLQKNIDKVRKVYMDDAKSTNDVKMQLGTVLWLIDRHGIRPGDTKTKDQADTVGASTIRVGQVKLEGNSLCDGGAKAGKACSSDKIGQCPGGTCKECDPKDRCIKFDFLGKDSIRFEKTMKTTPVIYSNFKKLTDGKNPNSQVFNLISAANINEYLRQFDVNFSSKVFRTRLASDFMFQALKTLKIPKNANKRQTKRLFNTANIKVADILNHARTISPKPLQKLKDEIVKIKKELKKAKKSKKSKKVKTLQKRLKSKKESLEEKK